jgi:hypothetical protein
MVVEQELGNKLCNCDFMVTGNFVPDQGEETDYNPSFGNQKPVISSELPLKYVWGFDAKYKLLHDFEVCFALRVLSQHPSFSCFSLISCFCSYRFNQSSPIHPCHGFPRLRMGDFGGPYCFHQGPKYHHLKDFRLLTLL